MRSLIKTVSRRDFLWVGIILLLTSITALMRPILAKTYELSIRGVETSQLSFITQGILLGLAGMAVVNGSKFALEMVKKKLCEKKTGQLRRQYFSKLLSLPVKELQTVSEGKKILWLTEDVSTVARFIPDTLQELLFGLLQLAFSLLYIFSISTALSLMAIVAIAIGVLVSNLFLKKIQQYHNEKIKEDEMVQSFFHNRLGNLSVTKIFALAKHHLEQFGLRYSKKVKAQIKLTRLQAFFQSAGDLVPTFSLIIINSVGFYFIMQGKITVSQLIGFSNVMPTVFWPFYFLPTIIKIFSAQVASAKRLQSLEAMPSEKSLPAPADFHPTGLSIKEITFRYDDRVIFSKFSFQGEKGDIVEISGPSGSGKSTLIKLILGFEAPAEGKIVLCAENQSLESCFGRDYIAYLPQNHLLLQDTVLENITLGNSSYHMESVVDAAKAAQIHDVIETLPDGYHTLVEQGGKNFSGGQLQRLCLARTLLKNSPILILDEPSSALDAQTEEHLIQVLKDISKDKLIFLVSHTNRLKSLCNKAINISNTHELFLAPHGRSEQ